MNSESSPVVVKDNFANPAPLGLFGFGMTTILLNLHNAGLYEMNSMILAMGLFYGGTAQVIAGILEYKKNNTFGMTAFISYGFFWISLVALIFMGKWGWISPTPGPAFVLAPAGYPPTHVRRFASETPLKRIGSPTDVANAVRYLVDADYVTGEVLFVDGGRHGAR